MSSFFANLDVDVVLSEFHVCGPEWNFKNVFSPFARIYLITEGEAYVKHHEQVFRLSPGYLYLIPDHTMGNYNCPNHMEQYFIHVSLQLRNGQQLFDLIKPRFQVKSADLNASVELMKQVGDNYQKKDIPNELKVKSITGYFLSLFLDSQATDFAGSKMERQQNIRNAALYIENNADKKFDLRKVAKIAGLHPTYFSNSFTEIMGISPRQYYNKIRIRQAQEIIWFTDRNLDEIADQLGFTDAFHFSRTFKKYTGIPPSEYRKQKDWKV